MLRPDPLDVDCPICLAPFGHPCGSQIKAPDGGVTFTGPIEPHEQRWIAMRHEWLRLLGESQREWARKGWSRRGVPARGAPVPPVEEG